MTDLSRRIQTLQDRLHGLSAIVNEVPSRPSDTIARIKRSYLHDSSPVSSIKVMSIHSGTSEGNLKIVSRKGRLFASLYIDDLLEEHTKELSYRISNFNPRLEQITHLGIIYHVNGLVISNLMNFYHEPETENYRLDLTIFDGLPAGRTFIVFEFEITTETYDERRLTLHLPTLFPGRGSPCRPDHPPHPVFPGNPGNPGNPDKLENLNKPGNPVNRLGEFIEDVFEDIGQKINDSPLFDKIEELADKIDDHPLINKIEDFVEKIDDLKDDKKGTKAEKKDKDDKKGTK
jgi:hypothetical protein